MKKITLSGIFALTLTLLAYNVSAQRNILVNGDFTQSLTTGWSSVSNTTLTTKGLAPASTASAYIVNGAMNNLIANPGTDFTYECYFAVASAGGTNRAFALNLDYGVFNLRINSTADGSTTGGIQIFNGSAWMPVGSADLIQYSTVGTGTTPSLTDADAVLNVYRLQLVFRGWGGATPVYDVLLSSANSNTLATVATNLSYFQVAGAIPTAPLSTVVVIGNQNAGMKFLLDAVKIISRNQTIKFDAIPAKSTSDASFALTATSSVGLPVTYTSSNHAVATVSGSTVTIVGAGSTDIKASAAGDALSDAAADVTQLLSVTSAPQTNVILNGDFELGTVGAAPGGWVNTVISGRATVGVTNVSPGLNSSNQAASIVASTGILTQSFADAGSEFTIEFSFSAFTPADRAFKFVLGSDLVTMRASAAANLDFYSGGSWNIPGAGTKKISYNVDVNANKVIDVGDEIKTNRVKLVFHQFGNAASTFDVYLDNGDGNGYTALALGFAKFHGAKAPLTSITIFNDKTGAPFMLDDCSIIKNQVITFAALPTKVTTDADFTLTATSSAGLPVTYTSSNPSVATVSGSTVHIVGAGETDIKASAASTSSFTAAADVIQKLTVSIPTGFNQANSNVKVYVVNRRLVVTGITDEIKAYTVTGAQVNSTKEFSPGMYIIKVGSQTSKVLVQ